MENRQKVKIYLAGPLFTEAQQNWLRDLKKDLILTGFDVLWPYELFNQEEIASWGADAAIRIMEGCKKALDSCNLVVALLDGPQVDDGTAWELGYAYARGIPAVGIRTDRRYCGETLGGRVNAMIAGSIPICLSREYFVEWLLINCPQVKGR